MNKLQKLTISDGKKAAIAGLVAAVLLVLNVVPLHHFERRNCPERGSYTVEGTTMGVPMAYVQNLHPGADDCTGFDGVIINESSRSFSAQALVTDVLVFGVVMVGVNALLDRRTKA